jgi:hypothetical protein
MSRAFSYNDTISYSKPIQEIKNSKMKKKQTEKIIQISTHSSYSTKYSEDLIKFVYIKAFYVFTSSIFRSILNEFYTNMLRKFMLDSGLEKKIKLKLGNIETN